MTTPTTAPVPAQSELNDLIERLEAAAGKATPGEWSVDGFNLGGVISRASGKTHVSDWEHLAVCRDENSNWRADAQFIALANPANILALTAAARRSIAPTAVKAEPELTAGLCPRCAGTGKDTYSTGIQCWKCSGTGAVVIRPPASASTGEGGSNG